MKPSHYNSALKDPFLKTHSTISPIQQIVIELQICARLHLGIDGNLKKKIHFLEKLSIPSADEEAPMEIYRSYEDKHLNVYEPIKTVDIINETFMPTYSNSIPMIPSDFGLNPLISTQPH